MKPPAAKTDDKAGAQTPAPSVLPEAAVTLSRRSDFLRAAQARRQGTPGFTLQARPRDPAEAGSAPRIGFTCSRKVGNAVTRNRAKRRLRALARAVMPVKARNGWDYVLIGRPEATVMLDYRAMVADLERAFDRVHADRAAKPVRAQAEPSEGPG